MSNINFHVEVPEGQLEKALMKFNRKIREDKFMKKLLERERFEKPSVKQRKKRKLKKYLSYLYTIND